jgi:hypothetical protein
LWLTSLDDRLFDGGNNVLDVFFVVGLHCSRLSRRTTNIHGVERLERYPPHNDDSNYDESQQEPAFSTLANRGKPCDNDNKAYGK